jgi:hypothetical protein
LIHKSYLIRKLTGGTTNGFRKILNLSCSISITSKNGSNENRQSQEKPQGWFMILISGIGLMVFVLSEAGILPKMVGGFRMDLFLMMCLALCGLGNYLVKK